eukprot:CAMPEP_0198234394 /NCGR_PEP_ID=MMETSP1446-20131203/428_1 /TAXON_ID=1461542 ORGANISM="Unidentified sp, Strain CCMP2111" /NCGR_SAMPLE_ID=MMETSP1446 /ASSEMBLY_ACC=CAM_ASM_001112 /LENGTH=207 /DNA_ID=CAMNT_0043915171 /DNA_START=210 /DNA_END=833 /DNA_ORIENTATION=-
MWKAKVVAAGIFTVLVVWAAAPWFAIGATRNGFESLNEELNLNSRKLMEASALNGSKVLLNSPYLFVEWSYEPSSDDYVLDLTAETPNWISLGFSDSCRMVPAEAVLTEVNGDGSFKTGIYSMTRKNIRGMEPADNALEFGDVGAVVVPSPRDGVTPATKLTVTRKSNVGGSITLDAASSGGIPVIWAVGRTPTMAYHQHDGCFTMQ